MSADPLQRVDLGQEATRHVEFSYSVKWLATDVPFAERMHRYAQYSFLPQSFEIHWLSIINSFVLVLLLTGAPPGTRLGPHTHTHSGGGAPRPTPRPPPHPASPPPAAAGFLSIILMRVLKNDFSRYARADEEEEDEEESGWKLVHGDVFRLPPMPSVFCAYIGTGCQVRRQPSTSSSTSATFFSFAPPPPSPPPPPPPPP